MSLLDKMRDTISRIRQSPPGSRFVAFYRYRKEQAQGSWLTEILMISTGIVMLAIGILGVLLPILPGFLFFIPGLAIFVSRSLVLAKALDRTELAVRRLIGKR